MLYGVQQTITYVAWNTSTNAGQTGDSGNHTLRWVKNGTSSATTNSPSEVDSVNCPGLYKVTITATEWQCLAGTLAGKSSTANVSIMPQQFTTIRAPDADPGASGGLPTLNAGLRVAADATAINTSTTAASNLSTWLQQWITGTAQTGSATTLRLAGGSNANDDWYNRWLFFLTGGTGAGQVDYASDYNGTTKDMTKSGANWITTPDGTTTYLGIPYGALPGVSAPTAAEIKTAVFEGLISSHSGVSGSLAERMSRFPNIVAGSTGGLPITASNNLIAGITGTKQTLDNLNDVSSATVNAQCDLAIETYRLHELMHTSLTAVPASGSFCSDLTEDNGGTQRFTAAALVNTPVPAGVATSANQTTIINHLTDIKGVGFGSSDALSALDTDLDATITHLTDIKGAGFGPSDALSALDTDLDSIISTLANIVSGASGVTVTSASRDAIANSLMDLANSIETGVSLRGALRAFVAALVGLSSGHAAGLPRYRNVNNTKNVIAATTNPATGDRTAVVLDLT